MKKEELIKKAWIILHANHPLDNLCFSSEAAARNWLKMTNSKKRFKEFPDNVFTCKQYGSKFKIIKLHLYKTELKDEKPVRCSNCGELIANCDNSCFYEDEKPMKLTEQQKQKICDLIEKALNSARLKNHKTDDDDALPLVDLLSTGETILEGQIEIENIVEQIFFDMDNWSI